MLNVMYSLVTPWACANKFQILKNRILGRIANIIYPLYCNNTKIKKSSPFNNNIVVSMTTFPARISTVHLCIESILRQEMRAEKVILWLATSQFPDETHLPKQLLKLKKNGLEIKYCEDLKSYKKIFYTAQEFPNKIIITADDDVLYPKDWITGLFNLHLKYPECVCCYRAARICFDINGEILPYRKWDRLSSGIKGPLFELVPTGVGGVLYPEYFFENMEFDFDLIKKLCPTADDLWLKIISLLKNRKAVKVNNDSKEWFTLRHSQSKTLTSINVDQNINDIALKNLLSYYQIDMLKYNKK